MTEKRLTKWGAELKKIISAVLAAIVLFSSLAVGAVNLVPKAEASDINFKCGDNLTWDLDEYGVLTISGTGEMYNFYGGIQGNAPWYEFRKSIYSVIIEEGVTSIGSGAFRDCSNGKSVHIASTVTGIGAYCFGQSSYVYFPNITIAENSMLIEAPGLGDSKWFANQPNNQPVYLGRFLYRYKGAPSEEFTVNVKEGTYAIGSKAIYNRNLKDITFPDSLVHIGSLAFDSTIWLENQPVGPIYTGNVYYGYKGEIPVKEADFSIKEGTKGIASMAFYGSDRIISVNIPSSVEAISTSAFSNCVNLKEVTIEDESNLKYIGGAAFSSCSSLEVFDIPEGVEYLGNQAFYSSKVAALHLPASLRWAGTRLADDCYLKELTLEENNPYLYLDKHGVLYNESKTMLIYVLKASLPKEYTVESGCRWIRGYAFFESNIEKINFNEELEYIDIYAFKSSKLKSVVLPDSVKAVETGAFSWCQIEEIDLGAGITEISSYMFSLNKTLKEIVIPSNVEILNSTSFEGCTLLEKAVIPPTVTRCYNAFKGCSNITIYCYEDSAAHKCAVSNSIPYVLLDGKVDRTEIAKVISLAEIIDRSLYTSESLKRLDSAVNAVDLEAENLTQEQVNIWCDEIEKAIDELAYKAADYAEINAAKEKAENINRSIYTHESLEELDKAISAVDYDLTIDKQSQIAEWVSDIESAISNLKYKPADYSAVETEISMANAIDRRYYSEISLITLDAAINAVDYSLNITKQEKVDLYAKAIANAISALEYASIVLRHEPCGVIVSATTKEIKPDTLLAVEEVDPSNYEGTNFAVGGSIRSLHFYDINLVYEAVVVQPDGTVTVKIKLADGVDPAKCKVYHVTEDIVNPLVRFASTIDGNYIVFETDHFSEFAVIEVETVLDSIKISTQPAKTEYSVGEQLDLTGMKVVAYYSDGTSKEVADYNAGMVDMQSAGTKKVTVYYTFGTVTKSTDFNITVTGETKNVTDIIIRTPSITTVNYGDSIWLHAKIEGDLPAGARIIWTPSNNNFEVVEASADGMSCKITPKSSGTTTFTVSAVDANENVLATDTQYMTSKAGLWQKIVAFFKKLFGLTKTYPELYKNLF